MEGICYIVAAGHIDKMTLDPGEHDFVIAADAGYMHLAALSAVADLVVGDFDSMPQKPNHPNIVVHPAEKDETDTILAMDEGLKRGYRTFVILGGLGGRLDHTLANIQALCYLAEKGARGFLLGCGTAVTAVKNGCLSFGGEKKGVISVFCCGDPARGVNLRGLKYELHDAVLRAAMPLGVSNEFTGADSTVTVGDGTLAVLWEESAADVIDNLRETCYSATNN
ncbi:thiamine pyrophosphokinase [Sporobacter termitidis DSM 10068]|uniref:Thiamine diphosphokinase n=1 Tax=Sporobacter termitidis DSM 10068 TaxID=1123282 RepID=A0A1M5U5X4_9FIRM|nr:thiamine diphosphokinase [Sporobacter termitidis]SHH58455.1 thiamine pyrophosphokinase [Sporobacter termitidis DSM 10068]